MAKFKRRLFEVSFSKMEKMHENSIQEYIEQLLHPLSVRFGTSTIKFSTDQSKIIPCIILFIQGNSNSWKKNYFKNDMVLGMDALDFNYDKLLTAM